MTIDLLINRLNDTPVMNRENASKMYRERLRRVTQTMITTGQSYGQASLAPAILNQDEAGFRRDLKNINDDLDAQIKIFDQGLDSWFQYGEPHPPYYPWRIAVILSKQRMKDKEEAFLRAYMRHFKGRPGGARDAKIDDRAAKFGI